jgi:hypothetical protein
VGGAEEFELYLAQPQTEDEPLGWWKAHEKVFPTLSRMAKDYLAIPASSTSVERLFSSSGSVCTNERGRLNETSIQALTSLKQWLE